jgi:crossover junction endodeoxyribonuclease RusA
VTTPADTALDIFVAGKPAPQGSIRAIVHKSTGRAVAIKDNNTTQKTWRGDIREHCLDTEGQPRARFDGPVRVLLEFVMPRPLSTPKKSTPPAVKKPDIDKLQRAVLDAISSAGVWRDDSQVVDIHATKRLAELDETSGCRIRIEVA